MYEYSKGQINTYCEMVRNGCKPVACFPVQERNAEEAKKIINGYSLIFLTEILSDGWLTIWIYKYPYMAEIIKALPDQPQSAYDHWVLGKAFGYSDEAIGQFLEFVKAGVSTGRARG